MNPFQPDILHFASLYHLDPTLLAAVILHESNFNPYALRFEEKWHATKLLPLPRSRLAGFVPSDSGPPSLFDEKVWRAHSWGLTQILGETARVLGFQGRYLSELLDPKVNIHFGAAYLSQCFFKARLRGSTGENNLYKAALLRYNGGGNPAYPEAVLGKLETAKELMA